MSRGDQLIRQWTLLRLLADGRRSRRELAQELGVSLKTITRDVLSLSLFPIAEEREGIDVFYTLIAEARTPQVRLSPEELLALRLSEETLRGALEGSPYAAAVAGALSKIDLFLRETDERALARRPQVFHSSFLKPHQRSDLQEQLHDAALSRRLVRLTYFTAERGTTGERLVEPYVLHLHPRGVHLIAYCRERQDFLYFSLGAIQALDVLGETFDPQAHPFDLQAFLATVFDGRRGTPLLDVHLRIKEPTAHWARDQVYHPSQELTEIEGGIELRFRAGAPEAIAARVLSLGPDCEVLAPPTLAQEVAAKARAIAELYRPSAAS